MTENIQRKKAMSRLCDYLTNKYRGKKILHKEKVYTIEGVGFYVGYERHIFHIYVNPEIIPIHVYSGQVWFSDDYNKFTDLNFIKE